MGDRGWQFDYSEYPQARYESHWASPLHCALSSYRSPWRAIVGERSRRFRYRSDTWSRAEISGLPHLHLLGWYSPGIDDSNPLAIAVAAQFRELYRHALTYGVFQQVAIGLRHYDDEDLS